MSANAATNVGPSIALVVLWSSGFIGAELGTRQAPASTLLAWRYLVAAAILIALCLWRRERISRAGLGRQVVLGTAVPGGLPRTDGERGRPGRAVRDDGADRIDAAARGDRPGCARAVRARSVAQLLGLAWDSLGCVLVVSGDLTAGDAPWWAYVLPFVGMLSLAVGHGAAAALATAGVGADLPCGADRHRPRSSFWLLGADRGHRR